MRVYVSEWLYWWVSLPDVLRFPPDPGGYAERERSLHTAAARALLQILWRYYCKQLIPSLFSRYVLSVVQMIQAHRYRSTESVEPLYAAAITAWADMCKLGCIKGLIEMVNSQGQKTLEMFSALTWKWIRVQYLLTGRRPLLCFKVFQVLLISVQVNVWIISTLIMHVQCKQHKLPKRCFPKVKQPGDCSSLSQE